jgi:hypothetical protein
MPDDTSAEAGAQGWWSIRQRGMRVCGGSGPYEACRREAAHYAALYEADGPVEVIVQRAPQRKAARVGNPPATP